MNYYWPGGSVRDIYLRLLSISNAVGMFVSVVLMTLTLLLLLLNVRPIPWGSREDSNPETPKSRIET